MPEFSPSMAEQLVSSLYCFELVIQENSLDVIAQHCF